ncbi:hypothetical protein D1872_286760 [compost metagenome]
MQLFSVQDRRRHGQKTLIPRTRQIVGEFMFKLPIADSGFGKYEIPFVVGNNQAEFILVQIEIDKSAFQQLFEVRRDHEFTCG